MRHDKSIATQLRMRGKSYNQIYHSLGIKKSTLSTWFSSLKWSQVIKNRLTLKANKNAKKRLEASIRSRRIMWEQWREQARQEARKNFLKFQNDPLFITGLMLYWGEGDSKIENSAVRLSNTDSKMIRIFSLFLRQICAVPKEKLRLTMILYPDLNEKKCKLFWSKASGIPKNQFSKTQYIKGKHPTKRLLYGICAIRVSSREIKEKIFVWLKLIQENLIMRV